jgi:uncharacterized Zn finger protein (UPF0148 family)
MGVLGKERTMKTDVLRRPEVQLGTCPHDGGMLFRQYDSKGDVWWCATCDSLLVLTPEPATPE